MVSARRTFFGMSIGTMIAQHRVLRDVFGVNSAWFLVVGENATSRFWKAAPFPKTSRKCEIHNW